jgi:hypothetical protein
MIKKKLHLILNIFLLVVFFTMSQLLMGCDFLGFEDTEGSYMEEMESLLIEANEATKEDEDEAIAEEKEKTQEDVEVSSFPNEPITYTGDISGVAVNLIVDFKSTNVFGRIQNPSGVYDDFIITEGNIDSDTLEVNAIFWGITEIDSDGNEIYSEWTLKGRISDDLSMFNGILLDNEGEIGEFTATRENAQ